MPQAETCCPCEVSDGRRGSHALVSMSYASTICRGQRHCRIVLGDVLEVWIGYEDQVPRRDPNSVMILPQVHLKSHGPDKTAEWTSACRCTQKRPSNLDFGQLDPIPPSRRPFSADVPSWQGLMSCGGVLNPTPAGLLSSSMPGRLELEWRALDLVAIPVKQELVRLELSLQGPSLQQAQAYSSPLLSTST